MRVCSLAVLSCALIAMLSTDVMARGGGRGGPGRAGGVGGGVGAGRGGNLRPGGVGPGNIGGEGAHNFSAGGPIKLNNGAGNHGAVNNGTLGDKAGQLGDRANSRTNQLQTGQQNFQNKTSQLKTNFTGENRPFTSSWYGNHPNAWQYTHPHADAWAVAGLGAAGAWLGLGGVGAANVYTSDTGESEESTTDSTAEETAQSDPNQLTFGVFAIAPANQTEATALIQLSANKQGQLSGAYYDVLTEQEQPITGTIDKSGKAQFRAGQKSSVTFETTLADLTQSTGKLALNFDNGQTRQWTLARFDERERPTNN